MMAAPRTLESSPLSPALRKPMEDLSRSPSKLAGLQSPRCRELYGCEGQDSLWFPQWPESIIVTRSSSNVQISVLSTTTHQSVCLAIQNRLLVLLPRAHTPGLWVLGLSQGKLMVLSACFTDMVVSIMYFFCFQVFSLLCSLSSLYFALSFLLLLILENRGIFQMRTWMGKYNH